MDQVARGWLMYELTNSAVQLGAVTAIRAIPLLIFSPVAGTLADRHGRKTQLVVAETVNAVLYAMLAILVITRLVEPWHLYAVAVGSAVVQVFHGPARQAMITESVDPREMTNAIGLSSIAFNGSRTIGPTIAGVLIALAGTGACYVVQAGLFALTTIWTIQLRGDYIRLPSGARRGPAPSFRTSMVEGWRFVRQNETVRSGMLILMLASFFAVPFSTLLPIFAKDILHAGATGQGLLLTGMGIGALLSSILIASLGNRLPKGRFMVGGAFTYGALLIVFAASHWLVVSVVLMVVIGLVNVWCNALVQTVVQANAPSEIRGRVMGVYQQRDLAVTAGSMLIGALAAASSAPAAVAAMGAACAVGAATIALAIPHVRTIR
jgi:MFS family permease